jgi:glycosyltransferase involved in cell wall biosynthesis
MGRSTRPVDDRKASRPAVIISANSFWNIVNFRTPLVITLVDEGYRVIILAPGPDTGWARAHGAEVVGITMDRSGLNPIVDARLFIDYLRAFRRFCPDFYLSYTAKPNIYGSLAARVAGVGILPNVSGLGTAFIRDGLLSRFVGLLYRLAFRNCPIVFFQNPDDCDLFVTRKIVKQGQARLLPGSGIDLSFFKPIRLADDGQLRFLFIGRLLGDKGVREFVEAARLLKREHPDWRFQLLGSLDDGNRSGIGADELAQWIEQGLVEHLGQADDVRPHVAAATAIVLPSYREGLPRSLLEAAAMARPLIASDVPGNRQLVENGVNGLLCEVRDPQSLADAMLQLGTMDANRRAEMGRAGRALVERSYGVEKVIAAYLEAIAQLAPAAGV